MLANVALRHASCRPVLCPMPEWRVQHWRLKERSTFVLTKYDPRERRVNVFENTSKRCLEGWIFELWLPSGQDQEGPDILVSNQVCCVYLWPHLLLSQCSKTLWVKYWDHPAFECRVFLGGALLDLHTGKWEQRGGAECQTSLRSSFFGIHVEIFQDNFEKIGTDTNWI